MLELPALRGSRLVDAGVLGVALAVFLFATWVRPHVMRGLINDEAVETLQALDVPADHSYYFVPSYHGGRTDVIESVATYANRLLWRLFGFGTRPILIFHAATLALAVWVFYRALRRIHSARWAAAGTVLLGASSYVVFYNQILTRNALAPLGSAIILWAALAALGEGDRPWRAIGYLIALAGFVTLAMATYTSFKVLALPVYATLAAVQLIHRKGRTLVATVASGLFVVALTAAAMWWTKTPPEMLIQRGQYAMVRPALPNVYGQHLLRTYLLPVWRDPDYKAFITEETNEGYARAMLPIVMAPFFVGGWLRALVRGVRTPAELFLGLMFLGAIPLLALGGPNLKHCLALYPWVAALAIGGVCGAYRSLTGWVRPGTARAALGVLAFVFIGSEGLHLLRTIPANPYLLFMTTIEESTAQAVINNVGDRRNVLMIHAKGIDIVRLEVRLDALRRGTPPPSVSYFEDQLDRDLAQHLYTDTDALMVIAGEEDPRFLAADPLLRDCFDRSIERKGGLPQSIYRRRDTCGWEPPPALTTKPS